MHALKTLNKILVLFVLLAVIAGGGVYGWSVWQNEQPRATAQLADVGQKEGEPADDGETAILGQNDSNEMIEYQKGNAGVILPGDADKDLFQQKSEAIIESFSFVAIGDSEDYDNKGYEHDLPALLQAAKKQGPNLAFFTGDIVAMDTPYSGENRLRVKMVQNLLKNTFAKSYLVFGQHDIACGNECIDAWYNIFFQKHFNKDETRKLYHSFDHGNTHFVLLSSNYPEKNLIDHEQLAWLDQDLANSKKTHKIIFSHVPPISFFKDSAEACQDMSCTPAQQKALLNVLKKHQVDLVISGNENAFDHKIDSGIDYVLSGNSGNSQKHANTFKGSNYSWVSVEGNSITLKALDLSGKVLREIKIK